jgi:hypothetical protein
MKHLALSLCVTLLPTCGTPAHAEAPEPFDPFADLVEGIAQELAAGGLQQNIPDDDLLSEPPTAGLCTGVSTTMMPPHEVPLPILVIQGGMAKNIILPGDSSAADKEKSEDNEAPHD